MTAAAIWRAWNEFWFKPGSALPMGLYRIMFGVIILLHLALLAPDLNIWYGPNGVVSAETVKQWPFDVLIDPLMLMPPTEQSLQLFIGIFVLAAISLTLGLFTRFSAALVFIGLTSFHHRDWATINSGDIFMRLAALYLSFSNAGRALSLDRLIEVWTSRELLTGPPPPVTMWVHRLMQVQLSFLYCQAFWTKTVGDVWISGNALYYVTRLEDLRRFSLPPFLNNLIVLKLLTWFTLATEFALWTLIWVKECRYWVLLAGMCLHLGIDLFMNLPLFEYLMVTVYILWVDPKDLVNLMSKIRLFIKSLVKQPLTFTYDGANLTSARKAETVRRLDIFRIVEIVNTSKLDAQSAPLAL